MSQSADLQIGLHSHPKDKHYRVEAHLRLPGSDAPMEPSAAEELAVQFDLDAFKGLDDQEYGQALAGALFAPPPVRSLFTKARALTKGQDPPLPLRLRLYIGPGAQELHKLRWELLHDPEEPGRRLATDENTPFSRYLTSPDERPVRTRPQAGIRALVVVASPSNVGGYQDEKGEPLAPVDVAGELKRARDGLGQIPVTALCSDQALEPAGPPALGEILSHLRDGYDVLYLAAHGVLSQGDLPLLYLEDGAGAADVVPADDAVDFPGGTVPGLVSQLSQLPQLPRLVVLASCQSAGVGENALSRDTRALAALGPRLAAAGVPAVVAMQGSVTMKTVEQLMPVFFTELRRDGRIDRAMAAARQAVQKRPDWWMPVLFSRLESGLLFSARGHMLGEKPEAFWTRLLKNIARGKCTPILGPGVTVDLLPSPADLARTLAAEYGYSLPYTDNLARVGQFVATHGYAGLCEDVVQALADGFKRRMGLKPGGLEPSLSDAIEAANWSERVQDLFEGEIHHQLAALNLPLYLTTSFDSFMTQALRAARPPGERDRVRQVAVKWREQVSQDPSRPDFDLDPPPSVRDPVVLHLFGTDQDPESMVLTEDDYLDYLARIFRDHQALLPASVKAALASTSLLFLGYDLHDLALKVILRGLLANVDLKKWKRKHVAVQIEPSAVDQAHQKELLDYLRTYFSEASDVEIDVYWGSTHQFVADLHSRWQEQGNG